MNIRSREFDLNLLAENPLDKSLAKTFRLCVIHLRIFAVSPTCSNTLATRASSSVCLYGRESRKSETGMESPPHPHHRGAAAV